jgi:high affinity sulfate transporter 1
MGYRWTRWLVPDVVAGAALAALVIPESVGYARVAGLPPEVGLYAAPLALIGYAVFGGSRLAVVATASAVSAVSASVVGGVAGGDASTFVALSAALAVMSGVIYLALGLARLGWIANFISRPVLDGFIVGLAIFIIIGQLGDLVGVETEGAFALAEAVDWIRRIGEWNPASVAVGAVALALLFALERLVPRLPAALAVVVLSMIVVAAFDLDEAGLAVVGELPTGLPAVGVPDVSAPDVVALLAGAFAVTLVGFSEGFASVTAFKRPGEAVNVNRELMAFGVANVGAGLSSGMVVGGSLSKTAAVSSAGGRTQLSNVVAALIVVAALLAIGPLFALLPEAVLAAVVIHAVWGLVRRDKFRFLRRVDRFDWTMALLVLAGTLLLEPIWAVLLGVAASVVHLVRRVSFPHRTTLGRDPAVDRPVDMAAHPDARPFPGVVVYRMDAPLLFVNAAAFRDGLDEALRAAGDGVVGVVVDAESMFTVDSTGVETLGQLADDLAQDGIDLRLARVRAKVFRRLEAGGVVAVIEHDRIHDRVEDAADSVGGGAPESGDSTAGAT